MPALVTWSPEDAFIGHIAPLGLAVAAPGPCLVVDLTERGTSFPGRRTLADLVSERPRRADLSPTRTGVAVVPNGGVGIDAAMDTVAHLVAGWPHAVVRVATPIDSSWQHLPVTPLTPLATEGPAGAVYQDVGWGVAPPGPGLVLPLPRRRTWAALAAGHLPRTDRWLRRLGQVWRWAQ